MKCEGRKLNWYYCGIAKFDNGMEMVLMDKEMVRNFKDINKVKELIEKDKKSRQRNKPIVVNGIGMATEKVDYKIEYRIEKRLMSKWEVVEEE